MKKKITALFIAGLMCLSSIQGYAMDFGDGTGSTAQQENTVDTINDFSIGEEEISDDSAFAGVTKQETIEDADVLSSETTASETTPPLENCTASSITSSAVEDENSLLTASYVKASISIDSGFTDSVFDARDSIIIPFTIHKYSNSEYGLYYVYVYSEDGSLVASNYDTLSSLIVGTTNLKLYWDCTYEPHQLGKYTVKYYTSNNTGGSTTFYIGTASGTCGSNLNWKLTLDGTMTISGTGMMSNYSVGNTPWDAQKDVIKTVTIEDGITSIGEDAFYRCVNLVSVSIPLTMKTIGKFAFAYCENLESVNIPEGVKIILCGTFENCRNMTTVYLPVSLTEIEGYAFDNTNLEQVIYAGSVSNWNKIKIQDFYNDPIINAPKKYLLMPESTPTPVPVAASLDAPVMSSAKNVSTGIKVTWNAVSGAAGYNIYRKAGTSGDWSNVGSVSAVSFIDRNVTTGVKYTYTVQAYNSAAVSSQDAVGKSAIFVAQPKITSLANNAAGKAAIKWSKNTRATGYQIYYVTGSVKKTVNVTGNSSVSKTITKLTKGKTYSFKIRSYKTISGKKYYSVWSAAKKLKITK